MIQISYSSNTSEQYIQAFIAGCQIIQADVQTVEGHVILAKHAYVVGDYLKILLDLATDKTQIILVVPENIDVKCLCNTVKGHNNVAFAVPNLETGKAIAMETLCQCTLGLLKTSPDITHLNVDPIFSFIFLDHQQATGTTISKLQKNGVGLKVYVHGALTERDIQKFELWGADGYLTTIEQKPRKTSIDESIYMILNEDVQL
jgi:hypothetical protein